MKELYKSATYAENRLKEIHFSNKCTDPIFHEFLAGLYDFAFSIRHRIGERMSDLDTPILEGGKQDFRTEAYEIIESLQSDIEEYIGKDKPTIGTDNLLRGIADELENQCGNTKAYLNNIG